MAGEGWVGVSLAERNRTLAKPAGAELAGLLLDKPGRQTLAGVPEGFDGRILAALASRTQMLHVCVDDARMARLIEALGFFAPSLEVVALPAWDCLPYDRVSPHRDIVARRIDAIGRLTEGAGRRPLVVTTVAALLQRLPPLESFTGVLLTLAEGVELAPQKLVQFLASNGYARSGTVAEAGEFAVRGGIVDLFPPGAAAPLRVDFFGDEVEAIREFDPLTQRSAGRLSRFVVRPVSELTLDAESIERFRSGYRERFGAVTDDPLYEAVSAGRLYPGLEHWLPLFLPRMETLLDYLPAAVLSLDHQAEDAHPGPLRHDRRFLSGPGPVHAREQERGGGGLSPSAARCALSRAHRAGEAPRRPDRRRLLALRRYRQRDRCRRPPGPGFRRGPGPARGQSL